MGGWLRKLGPGFLFAGAAIGVSHLVYATQAGATYSMTLLWALLLVHLFKYPFFEYGTRYAAVTGESLLDGYLKLGKGSLLLAVVITIATMFTVQAAVTLVTASLASYLFGGGFPLVYWSAGILLVCSFLLLIGRYQLLDRVMKSIVLLLTLFTLLAVLLAVLRGLALAEWQPSLPQKATGIAFLIAFMGWMPAPLDVAIWQSLWTLEKRKSSYDGFSSKRAQFDFRVGYGGTVLLALLFMMLGALAMHGQDQPIATTAAAFSQQLIEIYSRSLGSTLAWIVALAALVTMFSTVITCLDAFPRVLSKAAVLLQEREEPNNKREARLYWYALMVLVMGALVMLFFLLQSMASFLMVATILSFLTTPFFAVLNFRLVRSRHMPEEQQPGRFMKILSVLGILFLVGFCAVYVWSLGWLQ